MPADGPADDGRTDELLELLAPIHDEARRLARRLCRSDAEGDDLFHDAVVRALVKLSSLRERERFRFWFFRLLIRLHYSRARRSFWRRLISIEDEDQDAARLVGEDGSSWEDERFRAARARRALSSLPAEQRAAVVLFEVQGFSLEEIATIQDASVPAVKSRLARGREELRRFYERTGVVTPVASPDVAPATARGGEP